MKFQTKLLILLAGAGVGALSTATLLWPAYAPIFASANGLISVTILTLTGFAMAKGE